MVPGNGVGRIAAASAPAHCSWGSSSTTWSCCAVGPSSFSTTAAVLTSCSGLEGTAPVAAPPATPGACASRVAEASGFMSMRMVAR